MRRALVGASVAALATIGSIGAAGAAPPEDKKGEPWVCEGEETTIVVAGRSGWIDGVLYHAVQITFSETFTPTGGEPETFSDTQTWANGRGLDDPDAITCTAHDEGSDEEGSFVFDAEVIAVPVH